MLKTLNEYISNMVKNTGRAAAIGLVFFTAASSISSVANAELIVNGGFENVAVEKGKWRYFSSSQVQGWQGGNIEVWNGLGGMQSFEGDKHAELNAHPNNGQPFSIFQTFNTSTGGLYDLSFAYRARRSLDEAFRVELFGDNGTVLNQIIDDHNKKRWSFYQQSFLANSGLTTLRFTSVFPNHNTLGNFLDDVSVKQGLPRVTQQVSSVPEPAVLSLLVAGLFALFSLRIRRSRLSN